MEIFIEQEAGLRHGLPLGGNLPPIAVGENPGLMDNGLVETVEFRHRLDRRSAADEPGNRIRADPTVLKLWLPEEAVGLHNHMVKVDPGTQRLGHSSLVSNPF